jgi:mono/diheme cytochrome c family protein
MPKSRIIRLGYWASLVVMVAFCVSRVTLVSAQEENTNTPPPTSRQLPIRHSSGTKLTEQQERGAGLFIQRCALCHLSKSFGARGSKYCCVSSLGPSLSGMFKNLEPEQEQAMRAIILNGGPTYMPGWKYGLTPKDIDDIIAYLKTLG